jgi:glyoxylase-like metal-dependent hydrolase (beta-lactamase superfamily II)
LNPSDGYRFSGFNHLNDNQAITAGNAHINAIHTPGHTDGSTSFLIEGRWLLTGDTLFLDGIGRPDLREMGEQFAGNLYETYQKKILNLDGGVRVLPGHFSQQLNYEFGRPATATLTELRRSIPMITLGKDEFTRYLLANIPAKPPNHRAILSINRGDVPYDSHRHQVLEEGPNRCSIPVT